MTYLSYWKEEEDEEIMIFWLSALYLLTSNEGIEKIVRHASSQYGEEKLRMILGGHEKNCLVTFRMEPNIFRAIATYLRTEHLLRDTRGVTVEEKLGYFLFMMSHNASYEDLLLPLILKFTKSHPNAKKFRNKSFPLFEALGELYDGHTAEGTFNFTSIAPPQVPVTQPYQGAAVTQPSQPALTQHYIQPSQHVLTQPSQVALTQPSQPTVTQHYMQPSQSVLTQPSQVALTQPSQPVVTQHHIQEDENFPFDSNVHNVETDDDELRIVEQPVASDAAARPRMEKRVASTRNKDTATSDKTEKAGQRRRQDGKVVEMMRRFLEMKEKQAETESMQKERATTDEFPIAVCISLVDNMEDLSDDERIGAYDVFKDPQNRTIFMTAKDSTRLKWLRKKIRTT